MSAEAARRTLDELLRTGAWLIPAADQVHDIDEAGLDAANMVVVLCTPQMAELLGMQVHTGLVGSEEAFQGTAFELKSVVAAMRRLGTSDLADVVSRGVGPDRVQVVIEHTGGWTYASVPLDDLRKLAARQVLTPHGEGPFGAWRVNAPGGSA